MSVDLSFLLAPLEKLLSYSQQERHFQIKLSEERRAKKKEALQANFEALHATRRYQELSAGTPDREAEFELSRLWGVAAIKAEGIFDRVHDEMSDKAIYWASALQWPQDVVVSKGIDLASMENKYRTLLNESSV